MTPLFLYLLITVKVGKFEKVSLNDTQNLSTVFNTLTAGQYYCLLNRDTLTQTIEMKLSLKGRTFSQLFRCIFEIR